MYQLTRNDGDLGMSKDLVGMSSIKVEDAIGASSGGFNKSKPFSIGRRNNLRRVGSLQLDLTREVTLEVSGINFSLQDVTSSTQTKHNEISIALNTRASCLPSITLILTTTRQN